MVKVIVGMMGSSVANGSSSMATPGQVSSFLSVVKKHKIVTELDTARVYNGGRSEELLGEVNARTDFAISTKAPGFTPGCLNEARILEVSAASHKALQQDKVDIYYIHGPDTKTPFEEQCATFNKLYQQGKFERFGVSNLTNGQVQKIYDICKANNYMLPSVYQGGYSPLHRSMTERLFPLLKKLNMQFYAFSPLAGGLLAKPVDQIINPTKGSRFEAMSIFKTLFINDTILAGLKTQTELCAKHDISIMEATLRWFMHHSPLGEKDGVIIGASTERQIEVSLNACEKGPLPSEVVQGFETMWDTVKEASPGYQA